MERFVKYVLKYGKDYRSCYVCYNRGQRSDLPRRKARVVLGIGSLEQFAWQCLLLPVIRAINDLHYSCGWPFSLGDSILNDGPHKTMRKLTNGFAEMEYVWFSRDIRAYDGSVPRELLALALYFLFSFVDRTHLRSTALRRRTAPQSRRRASANAAGTRNSRISSTMLVM